MVSFISSLFRSFGHTSQLRHLLSDVRDALRGTSHDYTEGSLARAVLILAVPMVLEMAMQSVFSVVDVYFVGRLGADSIAILGLSDALLSLVFAVSIGLSMGASATVARRIGEGSSRDASVAAVQAIAGGAALSVVLGVAGAVFAGNLLRLLGAGPRSRPRNVPLPESCWAAISPSSYCF